MRDGISLDFLTAKVVFYCNGLPRMAGKSIWKGSFPETEEILANSHGGGDGSQMISDI